MHWGYFAAAIAPVLTVRSGDLVQAEAITHHAGDAPELMMDETVATLFREIPESDRNPGVHIMTGPIFIEDAEPGDMIEVRYLSMTPRCAYGSQPRRQLGLSLQGGTARRSGVTIYELDANTQSASALYAYDFPGKYLVPGTITHCPVCDREPALKGVRVPARSRTWAPPAWRPPSTGAPAPFPRASHGGQYRQLADRRGRHDVLSRAGEERALLHRRSPRQPGRRGDFRDRHRGLPRRPLPDHPAQGFRLPVPPAGDAEVLDHPRLPTRT